MEAEMNRKEPLASNPSPNIREGDSQKEVETSRETEISRAVMEARVASAEARRKLAEQERIASEESRQAPEADRRDAEELRRSTEEFRRAAEEHRSAAEDLRTAAKVAKEVLEKAKQPQKYIEGMDFNRTPEDEIGGGKLFQIQMEQMSGYLAVRLTGAAQPGEGSRQFRSIAEHCKHTNNDKLLYDVTGYKVIKPHLVDKFILAERAEIFARYGIKVAVVCRPERLEIPKTAAPLAQKRGVKIEVFTDLGAAEDWLLT
jgi:hypothetical protein